MPRGTSYAYNVIRILDRKYSGEYSIDPNITRSVLGAASLDHHSKDRLLINYFALGFLKTDQNNILRD